MEIYNTLSRSLEKFIPSDPKKVTIYVCGVTPYDTTHLGHAFTYIFFDALVRYLKFQGYKVSYTQNVTDINDRDTDILQRAKEQNIPWNKLAEYWTQRFLKDMKSLNWVTPDYMYASENTHLMINLIKKLLNKNLAYQINGSIYLDLAKFPDFGKLSRLNKKQMLKTASDFDEDLKNPDKKQPLDFTLWRSSSPTQPPHIPSFTSPWGPGRPGWHIECSAMSMFSLGQQLDIHGGGKDLIFPHHEAEIVQSEGATDRKPFVKYWIHTGHVFYKGAKMSKSKGNLVMISDLLKKYSPNAIRWLLLSHYFREDWEFFEKDLAYAQQNVDQIEKSILHTGGTPSKPSDLQAFLEILDNNFDTPKALEFLLTRSSKKLYQILGFKL